MSRLQQKIEQDEEARAEWRQFLKIEGTKIMTRFQQARKLLSDWSCKKITAKEVKSKLLNINYTVDLRLRKGIRRENIIKLIDNEITDQRYNTINVKVDLSRVCFDRPLTSYVYFA